MKPLQSTLKLLLAASVLTLAACASDDDTAREEALRHIERSDAYADQGQFRAALIEARNAIRKAPNNPRANVNMAELLQIIGDNAGVISLLKDRADRNDDLKLMLSEAYINVGKYRSANDTLASVSAENQSLDWQLLKARAETGLEDFKAARARLKTALGTHPADGRIHLRLAEIDMRQERISDALKQIALAKEKSPENADILYTLAQIQYQQNRLEEAATTLTEALRYTTQGDVLSLQRTQTLRLLSQVLTEQGRSTEALAYTRLIAENNPQMIENQRKFNDAVELYQQGDLEGAQAMLSELYQENPGNSTGALLLGLLNFEQRNFDAAESLFKDHLDTELASPRVISASALSKIELERSADALELLEQALIDHEDSAELWSLYGLVLLNSAEGSEEGKIALEKSLALDPSRDNLRLVLARHHLRNGNVDQALGQLRSALDRNPDSLDLQNQYLSVLLGAKRLKDASRFVNQLASDGAPGYNTEMMLARVAAANSDTDTMAKHLKKASRLDKESPQALIALGRLALREGQPKQAQDYFKQATERAPEDITALQGLVSSYEANREGEKALAVLKKLAEGKQSKAAESVLADYYLRNGQLSAAERWMGDDQALAQDNYSQQVQLRYFLARATEQAAEGDNKAAEDSITQGLSLYNKRPSLLALQAQIRIAGERFDAAEDSIRALQTAVGDNPLVKELRGDLAVAGGSSRDAIENYRAAWDQRPNAGLARKLMPLLRKHRSAEEAAEFGKLWAQTLPGDPAAVLTRAGQLQTDGQCDKAIPLYEAIASRMGQNNSAIAVLNNLALCYLEVGDAKALDTAKQAYALAPELAPVVDTYGWVLFQSGQKQEGRKLVEKAATLDPDNEEIAEHLKAVQGG